MIVVLLYAMAILLAFLFAQDYPKNKYVKKAFNIAGKWAMTIYMTHPLIIYLVKLAKIPYSKRTYLTVLLGTVVASVLLEIGVKTLCSLWNKASVWLEKMCFVQIAG